MISFKCPNPECGKTFKVPDQHAGKKARCKSCGIQFNIPAREAGSTESKAAKTASSGDSPIRIAPKSVGIEDSAPQADRVDKKSPADGPAAGSGVGASGVASGAPTTKKIRGHAARLAADEQFLRKTLQNSPYIKIMETEGDPPYLYRIEYLIKGLAPGADGRPVVRDRHVAELQLPQYYPREKPLGKMLTPVFHPNIDPTYICYTDHWAPKERLLDVVIRIGQMIAYQSWNIKSPRDGEAAMWADLNRDSFPIDDRDLYPSDY